MEVDMDRKEWVSVYYDYKELARRATGKTRKLIRLWTTWLVQNPPPADIEEEDRDQEVAAYLRALRIMPM